MFERSFEKPIIVGANLRFTAVIRHYCKVITFKGVVKVQLLVIANEFLGINLKSIPSD